jgi:hypothetical protein
MPDDKPSLGEQMVRGMYLDPGFSPDKPGLAKQLHDDIDDTAKRAQANLDQQRANAAAIQEIAEDIEAERIPPPESAAKPLLDEPTSHD